MAYRIAKSLAVLRDQIDAAAPNRNKASDGWIGDSSHAARASDHNPGPDGIVQAIDITHDPANGCDAQELFDDIKRSNDPRLGYLIFNRRIWSPTRDSPFGTGRPYAGSNPHTKHIHVSVHKNIDSEALWAVVFGNSSPVEIRPMDPALRRPLTKEGARGPVVKELQQRLLALGYKLPRYGADGDFGKETLAAVKELQRDRGLYQDGHVGPYTWAVIFPDEDRPATTMAPVPTSDVPSAPGMPIGMDSWYEPGHFPPVSDFGEQWCKTIESFRANPYPDGGSWAQGYGHNAGSGVQPIPRPGGAAWSEAYATEVMRKDLALQVHYLNSYVDVPLLQRHVDALALDLFQMGPGNWKRDKVLALINAKDYAGAAQWMRDRSDSLGLDRRRNRQADIFLGMKPDPKMW